MRLGRPVWQGVRKVLTHLLSKDEPTLRDNAELRAKALFEQSQVENLLPANIGDYTDFYSSREHATNVGKLFRPDQAPLLPNWYDFFHSFLAFPHVLFFFYLSFFRSTFFSVWSSI